MLFAADIYIKKMEGGGDFKQILSNVDLVTLTLSWLEKWKNHDFCHVVLIVIVFFIDIFFLQTLSL